MKPAHIAVPLAVITLAVPSLALAGNTPPGTTINQIAVHSNGIVRLFFTNDVANRAVCSTQYTNAMAFSASTTEGKAMLAHAMALKISRAPVYVVGTGTCATYGILEDVQMVADG
jgi:hypothetical protein